MATENRECLSPRVLVDEGEWPCSSLGAGFAVRIGEVANIKADLKGFGGVSFARKISNDPSEE